MAFSFKTLEQVWSDFIGYLEENGIPRTSMTPGGRFYTLARAAVALHANGWTTLKAFTDAFYVTTATGDDLDRRVSDFGVFRKDGTKATGKVAVLPLGPLSGTLTRGTYLRTADGTTEYKVLADVTLSSSTVFADVAATSVGALHNRAAGTVLLDSEKLWANRVVFQVGSAQAAGQLTGAMSGGADLESDDELRFRFIDFLRGLGRSTLKAVRTAILSYPGVQNVVLQDAVPAPGYVTAWITATTHPMSQAMRDGLQQLLKVGDGQGGAFDGGWKAAGIRVKLQDVTVRYLDVEVSVGVGVVTAGADQAAFDSAVLSDVTAALVTFSNELRLGQSITLVDIIQAITGVNGVATASVIKPLSDLDMTVGTNEKYRVRLAFNAPVVTVHRVNQPTSPGYADEIVASDEWSC